MLPGGGLRSECCPSLPNGQLPERARRQIADSLTVRVISEFHRGEDEQGGGANRCVSSVDSFAAASARGPFAVSSDGESVSSIFYALSEDPNATNASACAPECQVATWLTAMKETAGSASSLIPNTTAADRRTVEKRSLAPQKSRWNGRTLRGGNARKMEGLDQVNPTWCDVDSDFFVFCEKIFRNAPATGGETSTHQETPQRWTELRPQRRILTTARRAGRRSGLSEPRQSGNCGSKEIERTHRLYSSSSRSSVPRQAHRPHPADASAPSRT